MTVKLVWGRGRSGFSECMSGTRGSGVVSSANDVLDMSVVRGVRGVGAVCMCLARVGWEVCG